MALSDVVLAHGPCSGAAGACRWDDLLHMADAHAASRCKRESDASPGESPRNRAQSNHTVAGRAAMNCVVTTFARTSCQPHPAERCVPGESLIPPHRYYVSKMVGATPSRRGVLVAMPASVLNPRSFTTHPLTSQDATCPCPDPLCFLLVWSRDLTGSRQFTAQGHRHKVQSASHWSRAAATNPVSDTGVVMVIKRDNGRRRRGHSPQSGERLWPCRRKAAPDPAPRWQPSILAGSGPIQGDGP